LSDRSGQNFALLSGTVDTAADRPTSYAVVLQNGDFNAVLRLKMAFIPRFLRPGRDHFCLLGPGGTGRTVWCALESRLVMCDALASDA
jgi:hypothetical protein